MKISLLITVVFMSFLASVFMSPLQIPFDHSPKLHAAATSAIQVSVFTCIQEILILSF